MSRNNKIASTANIYSPNKFVSDDRIKALNLDKFGKKMNPPEKGNIKLGEQRDQFAREHESPPGNKPTWKPTVGIKNLSAEQNIELTNGNPQKDTFAKFDKYSLESGKPKVDVKFPSYNEIKGATMEINIPSYGNYKMPSMSVSNTIAMEVEKEMASG